MKQKPTLNAADLLGPEEFADLIGETQATEFKPLVPVEPPKKRGVGRPKQPPKRDLGIVVRKQATKSSVTQQRIALEAGLRDFIASRGNRQILQDALDRILRVAAYGLEDKDSVAAARVLFDKLLSSAKQEEDAAQGGAPQVTIVIENATVKPGQPAIEAEFTEVKEPK